MTMRIKICYECLLMIDRSDKTESPRIRERCLDAYYRCCYMETEPMLMAYTIGKIGVSPMWNEITRSEVISIAMNDEDDEVGM